MMWSSKMSRNSLILIFPWSQSHFWKGVFHNLYQRGENATNFCITSSIPLFNRLPSPSPWGREMISVTISIRLLSNNNFQLILRRNKWYQYCITYVRTYIQGKYSAAIFAASQCSRHTHKKKLLRKCSHLLFFKISTCKWHVTQYNKRYILFVYSFMIQKSLPRYIYFMI